MSWQKFDDILFKKLKLENLKPERVENGSIKVKDKYISVIIRVLEGYFDKKVNGIMIIWGCDKTYREVELIKFTIDELIEKIKLIILW